MTKEEDKRQEEQLVEEELTMNNFPQEVIVREKKMARKRNQENERMEGRTDGDTSKGKESKRTVTIPYIKGMSEAPAICIKPHRQCKEISSSGSFQPSETCDKRGGQATRRTAG